ncbi:hypothetical protein RIF29_42408 [Crotalaria pallida]|uniref:Uncharacterized protein n=1 Tax=Crotalaria pallida TaxID=3830 RepID=A0AAN9E798_CROPI
METAASSSSPPSSSSSSSWRKSNKILKMVENVNDNMITESEMEAAQQLMELSDEDNSSSSNNTKRMKRKRIIWDEEEEEDEQLSVNSSHDDMIMAKIQEIFGNDVEVFRPKKQRRYRSLVNIYMVTTPLNAGQGTRVVI